jgi:CheY-like chemotaxis protein
VSRMADLKGLRALVVEDEGVVALMIEDMLLDLGCEIAASAADLDKGCKLAQSADIDFALLDLNLNGSSALPIAHILRERRIPFVFSTGYGAGGVSPEFASQQIVAKPFVLADLQSRISAALELPR